MTPLIVALLWTVTVWGQYPNHTTQGASAYLLSVIGNCQKPKLQQLDAKQVSKASPVQSSPQAFVPSALRPFRFEGLGLNSLIIF